MCHNIKCPALFGVALGILDVFDFFFCDFYIVKSKIHATLQLLAKSRSFNQTNYRLYSTVGLLGSSVLLIDLHMYLNPQNRLWPQFFFFFFLA